MIMGEVVGWSYEVGRGFAGPRFRVRFTSAAPKWESLRKLTLSLDLTPSTSFL